MWQAQRSRTMTDQTHFVTAVALHGVSSLQAVQGCQMGQNCVRHVYIGRWLAHLIKGRLVGDKILSTEKSYYGSVFQLTGRPENNFSWVKFFNTKL